MATRKPKASVPAKLVGKGTQGDFVKKHQEMGSSQGFKHVSKHWLETGCYTYDQIAESIEKGRAEIEDLPVAFGEMTPKLGDDGDFVLEYNRRMFKPTQYALRQIAGHAGVSVFDTEVLAGLRPDTNGHTRNRPEDRQALMTLFQTGFSLIDKKKRFLFRTQKDGTLRAWLSTQYFIIDNRWFLDAMREIIPGGVFSHWRNDGDFSTIWGNVLIPDSIRAESDSDYGGMFSIGNSEIGRRRLGATPSLFRAICMNGCIWDQNKGESFRKIHRGDKVDMFGLKLALRKHLTTQIPLIGRLIDDLMNTRNIGWDGAAAKPVFAALGQHFRLSKTANTEVLQSWRIGASEEEQPEEIRRSAFAVINAVTRSGRDNENPAVWVQRDSMGGQLLQWQKDDWKHLFGRARAMKPEDVVDSFVATMN